MQGASGKRENKGEEVSTLLGGLACSFLWETFTLSGTEHTQEYVHTHVLTKQMRFLKKRVANARAELADADGAEHMRVTFPHLRRSTSGAEQRSLFMTHREL